MGEYWFVVILVACILVYIVDNIIGKRKKR